MPEEKRLNEFEVACPACGMYPLPFNENDEVVHNCHPAQVQIRNDVRIEEELKRKHNQNHRVYYMGCLFCQKKM